MKDGDWLLAGVATATFFIIFYVVINIGLVASLLLASIILGGSLLLFRVKKPSELAKEADLESALAEGRLKLGTITAFTKRIQDERIITKVNLICTSIDKILVEVKRDPPDLKQARQFLSYYLDATINILNKYNTLSSQNVHDEGITYSLQRAEKMLDTLNLAFEKQLTKLLSNDVMNLDTEISLLESTIKMEGLGE